jgi:hypothetical protein
VRPIDNQAIVLLLSSFVLSIHPGLAIASEAGTPARPPNAAIHQEEAIGDPATPPKKSLSSAPSPTPKASTHR